MTRLSIVAVVAFILASLSWPGKIGAATISPGQSIHREVGPMTIDATIGREFARVTVALKLHGVLVGERVLTPASTEYDFAVVNGLDTAHGAVRVAFATPPHLCALHAELSSKSGPAAAVGYTGNLATWLATGDQIWLDTTIALAPDFFAHTVVSGANRTDVTVTLLAGSAVMYTVSVTQASPVAVISDSLALGDVHVAAGTRFTMTIPTQLQRGQMFMQALFQSSNIPPTSFAAAIATWP
jgi:hypothetical protein